jgi:hypothetical protein
MPAGRFQPLRAFRGSFCRSSILFLVLLSCMTGCMTNFRTGFPLDLEQQSSVSGDLAVAGVLARRPGESGARLPESATRLARLTGAEDRSATISEEDLALLLASPTEIRSAKADLESIAARLGNRYVLVGETSTAPTDELKSWIIQIIVPIPYLWIFFGIPIQYASNPNEPHAAVSTRIVDLLSGEILAATFAVGSGVDPGDVLEFNNAAASRAVSRMALERP